MTTVPAPLPASTLRAVIRNATGGPAPASISHLTNGVLKTMLWHRLFSRLGVAAAILIGTASLATGAIGLARRITTCPPMASNQRPLRPRPWPNPLADHETRNPKIHSPPARRCGSARPATGTRSTIGSLAVSPTGRSPSPTAGQGHGALRTYDLATGRVPSGSSTAAGPTGAWRCRPTARRWRREASASKPSTFTT